MSINFRDAVKACVTAISVKRRMKVCVKRDLLFFKPRRGYIIPVNSACSDRHDDRWKIQMQTVTTDVRHRVMALVKAILEQNAITATVESDTRLVDVGLTSMD